MASVQLKNVCKKYPNGYEAVKDFNLDIADKEFIIFVGPSGCGKSTTLRMVAGLEDISSGELIIDGKVMNDVEPKDRDIAMVFQSYALYPHMTVYDNMAFSLKLKKTPKEEIDKAVREAARILDLEKLLDRKPRALSGGQRQRVAMGRAIVRNPKVFLMDEPLSNLDAKLRGQMRVEISKLHQRLGSTIIYVTHDQTEAMTLGTRIVVMKDGVVQQIDTPQNLYDHPCNKFVAGFIGSPQMNMIQADAVEENGEVVLKFAGQQITLNADRAAALKNGGYVEQDFAEGTQSAQLITDILEGKDYTGPSFCSSRFSHQDNILPFMAQFPLEKLHLFGQEGILSVNELELMKRSEGEISCWIQIAKRLLEVPELLALSEHAMYIGQKTG